MSVDQGQVPMKPYWIEVWSEKGTIRGTLAPMLDKYGMTTERTA